MKMPNEFRKKWVTIHDIQKFTLREDEIMGEQNQPTYGILMQGRFKGCMLLLFGIVELQYWNQK